MNLSSELVSQFAKLTKAEKTKGEQIAYGTIVKQGDNLYVKLDGSNSLTPMSYTVDMLPGERVMVTIKNRTAIVTGNITSPAARLNEVREITVMHEFIKSVDDDIVIGDFTQEEMLYNILIGLTQMCIRNGNANLAKFSEDLIEIGNSEETINLYGNSLYHYINGVAYKPYYSAGDSISLTWNGAGFVTNSSANVCFSIPLSRPIVGVSAVTVESESGLMVRQNSNYTHGSSSSTYATPSSYSAEISNDMVNITATFSSTTNAVNESPCGITAGIKITFS